VLAARRVEATPAGEVTHIDLLTTPSALNRYTHDHAAYEGASLKFWTLRVTARYTHPGSRAADVSNLRVNSWPAPTATAAA
jgi:hypothetical protein